MSANIRHDRENWRAVLGERLTGRDDDGKMLSSSPVVLSIEPGDRVLRTFGGGGWDAVAQVHGVSDVAWVEGERFVLVTLDEAVAADVAERAKDGWVLESEHPGVRILRGSRVLVFSRSTPSTTAATTSEVEK